MGNNCSTALSNIYAFVQPGESVKINGRTYYIKKKLGEGGFATVHLVEEAETKRLYALKKILCMDEHSTSLGRLELKTLKQFDHPNILKLYNHTVVRSKENPEREEIYLLLHYYPVWICHMKGSLQDYLERLDRDKFILSEKTILQLFLSICKGVKELHSQEPPLAHRDIKPHNILLDYDSECVLCDFGSVTIARKAIETRADLIDLIEDSEQHCTQYYRAPELWDRGIDENLSVDERIDVWALGCLLYALAFHRSPFEIVLERGGILKLAIIEGKVDFPPNHPFSQQFVDLIKYIMNPTPQKRPFIDDVVKAATIALNELS